MAKHQITASEYQDLCQKLYQKRYPAGAHLVFIAALVGKIAELYFKMVQGIGPFRVLPEGGVSVEQVMHNQLKEPLSQLVFAIFAYCAEVEGVLSFETAAMRAVACHDESMTSLISQLVGALGNTDFVMPQPLLNYAMTMAVIHHMDIKDLLVVAKP